MFDDLFKTDTKTDIKTPTITSKPTGMFDDLFQAESKQTTVTPTQPITPVVTEPKKNIFQKYASWTDSVGSKIADLETNIWNKYMGTVSKITARPDESKLGTNVNKNTLAYLPSSITENLPFGIGEIVKQTRDDPETVAKVDFTDVLQGLVDTSKDTFKGLIGAGASFAMTPLKFNVPGLGEVSNVQYKASQQILAGEDIGKVLLDSGVSAIFDTLMLVGLAGEVAGPRSVTIAKQTFKGETPSGLKVKEPAKSFRLYTEPVLNKPLSPEFVKQMATEKGINLGPKYNPELPTYFKVTGGANGIITGEVVQIKPSYIQTFINQFKGNINNVPNGMVNPLISEKIDTKLIKDSEIKIKNDPETQVRVNMTPEQTKVAEEIRKDIEQSVTEGKTKLEISKELAQETGMSQIKALSIVEKVSPTTTSEVSDQEIIQQALNEAGSTLEETKTPEAVTEQPKTEKTQEQSLIEEARKFKTPEEFISSKTKRYGGEIDSVYEANRIQHTKEAIPLDLPPEQMVTIYRADARDFLPGDYATMDKSVVQDYVESGRKINEKSVPAKDLLQMKNGDVFYAPNGVKSLTEIWNKAQGEAKMKVKESMTNEQRDEVSKLLDGLDTTPVTVNGKPDLADTELYFRLDQLKTKNEKGKLTNEEYIEAKGLLEEAKLGLDTLKTKEDNKTYGNTKISRGVTKEEQPNGSRNGRSDVDKGVSYKLEKESRGDSISRTSGEQNESRDTSSIRELPRNEKESEVRKIVTDLLWESNPEAIDKIVSYYTRLDDAGFSLRIERQDSYQGYTQFDAFIRPINGGYSLTINNKDVAKLTPGTIDHEIGTHAYYSYILNSNRKSLFDGVKKSYQSTPELFNKFTDYFRTEYWRIFIKDFLPSYVKNANNRQISDSDIQKVIRENGFIDENNEVIYPEDIMETVFNFTPIEQKFNKYLVDKGFQPTTQLEEQNNIMAEEIVAFIADNSELFKDSTIPEVQLYAESINNNTLEFTKPDRTITFGGATFKLKDSTKLTSADIIKKHANIELKRDIIITDVYGEKATLKAGEGITPYEVTGNKFILQDGEAYLVSKSQAQNVINNSKTGEAKPFAPELKQTEETVIGGKPKLAESDIVWKKTIKKGEKNDLLEKYDVFNGTLGDRKFIIEAHDNGFYVGEEDAILGKNVRTYSDAVTEIDRYLERENKVTKYSSYTLPGGENYKEILIKAPINKSEPNKELIEKLERERRNYGRSSLEYQNRSKQLNELRQGIQGNFKSSHWDEPNVISHIRMNERTYNGKKVAFMEELQSDWAREGRDKGFIKDNTPIDPNKLPEGWRFKHSPAANGYYVSDQNGLVLGFGETKELALADTNKEIMATVGVPNNKLLKNWQELSIKRALQEAVNSNAKYFAWINGPQTAARYNLSKEVENIKWEQGENKQVKILMKGGSGITLEVDKTGMVTKFYGPPGATGMQGKKLDEVIGKGIAEKIMASPEGKLEGEGLNIGGEWATNLYDRQVRTIVENLTGQKVEMLDMGLPVEKDGGANWYQNINNRRVDIGLEITNKEFKDDYIGLEIYRNGDSNTYIITDVLGNGKFKAINENTLQVLTPQRKNGVFENYSKQDLIDLAIKNKEGQTFNIKPSTQMGIEITPEVKQIINGEAPQVKVSGKLPFTEQITAPAMFKIKLPDVNTGSKLEDAKQILAHVENKLGVSSIVNSIKDKETAVEIGKEVLDMSPMKQLEPYVADAGDYKGTLPEITGKPIQEIKKNKAYRGVRNDKAIQYANHGDEIAQEIVSEYGMDIDSNEVKEKFEDYQDQKANLAKQQKDIKQQKDLFKTTDTFKMAGIDKTLIGEITQTREMPQAIMEIMDQVRTEKKARREEVLNHRARPLMKYVDKKTQRLPKLGTKTAFGKEGEQILKDLNFDNVQDANKALDDYISKRNEFVNPISRLALEERNAKFLRDKQKILEEVEKKIRAEGRDRKSKIEAIRDFFYMTEGEVKDVIGDKDYRLLTETKFEELLKDLEEKSIEIAQHQVAVSEVEWTIAQQELHRVENLQQVMKMNVDLKKLTTDELNTLNETLGKYQRGDVFLGVREIETLAKNANLPDVKTQRQILEEVLGKRTGLPIEKLREIVTGSFDDLRSAVSLSRQNAFYEVLVSDFYQLKIEAGLRYREIEQKTNELVRKARASRPQSWKQKLAPTDDMVIAYLEEGDLPTKALIAKDMTPQELELAHYVKAQYAEMRDFLIARQQLEKERQNYYTHRPRGFFESWLRNEVVKTPTQFIKAFGRAFKETFIDVNKMDEASFKILNEQTSEILPLEKFFKYSMRRSGQLIPTKNLASAFLGYTKTFELKKGLDQYMPRMEAVARALTPTETTEGGVVKDTSLEKFVKKWINTQKGRPVTVGPIQPGGVLDGLLRSGVAFTRFLDLALRIPAQVMSLVGEESATWINIGTKKYLLGEYRAKTKQGNKIAKKYEAFVGTKFWDKMREESQGIASKLGETMFAFYGIASRQSNIHHLLGVITPEEFRSGNITGERLVQIKLEMNRWRADDLLHSVMGKTSIGSVFREHKSWAIPIVNQVLSNIKTLTKMVSSGEYQQAAKSKEFGELFRGTMLTLILVLTLSRIYKDLKEKKDRNLIEELEYRAMNDAQSFLAALSPTTLGSVPRLAGWFTDLTKAVTSFASALATGERTAIGDIPGAKGLVAAVTPKLIKPLLKETEEDKIQTSIDTSTIKAQKELDVINKDIVDPAQKAWDEVKKVGVGTKEADALVDELSDEEYEAYKLVKKADEEYWSNLAEKVTPIVNQAFKLEFGSEESNKLVEPLTDDEYAMYKTVKSNLYGKGEAAAQPTDWDKQSFITHILNIAKGWTTDPLDAFNKLIKGGDWKITDVKNGQIIVNRMPVDASEKIKEEAAKNNANYKLDHIWAVKAGGGSDKNNLNIISTDEWEENTPVEVYLIKQLDEGNITGEKAKEYMVRFKIGRGQVTSGPLFEKYKTPLTFEEIKQEIAK